MRRVSWTSRGFSLIELLVVLGVIALILSILLPALSSGRHAALDLHCRASFRDITRKFMFFADPTTVESRGDSHLLGENLFRIEDFQESVYQIDEFWRGGMNERVAMARSEHPMMCPTGPVDLERRAGMPCSAGAVGPMKNVSVAFNMRLHKRSRIIEGSPYLVNAHLTDKILLYPDTPLLFDVDGEAAAANDKLPYYSAPPIPNHDPPDNYADGEFWFPSFRHRGRMNVGFVGGHVLSTAHPLGEPWWRWCYEPNQ